MISQKLLHADKDRASLFYGYSVVIASFLIMLGMWASCYSFGVFFKPLLKEFGWTRALTSGAFSLSSLTSGLLAVGMGRLTDTFGPRLVMTLCGVFLSLGYVFMSCTSALWQLYVFYGVIVGAGMSGSFVPLMSTIPRWFVSRRGMMTGLVAAGVGIGGFLGPPIVDRLISSYGWRFSIVIMGAAVFVLVVLPAQTMRRDPSEVGQKPYGENKIQELNAGDESLELGKALRVKEFWLIAGNMFCFGFCVFSIMVHIVAHAIEMRMPSAEAAGILSTLVGCGIVGKILLGKCGDIIGSKNVLIIGLSLISVALLALVPASLGWILFIFACVFGFAYGGCAVSHPPLIAEVFGLNSLGSIMGAANLGFTSGGAIGPLVMGYLFDINGTYRMAFLVCSMVSFVGLGLMLLLKRGRVKV